MRKIKFRAWCKKDKIFHNWNEILNNFTHFFSGDKYELQQFTGLLDKDGKEIYEGDILKRSTDGENFRFVFVVEYDKGGFYSGYTYPLYNYRPTLYNAINQYGFGYDEVIGNIFENPNLLK